MSELLEKVGGDEWIQHAARLRVLARSLIADEHEAEDAIQETWLRFLKRPPSELRDARGFLTTILRNLSIERLRGASRRREREADGARDERVPSGAEIVERLELVKRVSDHVSALAEPCRSAIHLRYFEGKSPAAIARLTGVPLETVRSRLRRGREQLRACLDRDAEGDRESWCRILAPVAGPAMPAVPSGPAEALPLAPITPFLGILEMSLRAKLVIAVLAVGVAGILWKAAAPAAKEPTPPDVVADSELRTPEAPSGPILTEESTRTALGPATESQAVSSTPPALLPGPLGEQVEIEGRVILVDGWGREFPDESGSFSFYSVSDRGEQWIPASFEKGAWRASVPPGTTLEVGRLEARGRTAVAKGSWVVDESSERIVIRGVWPQVVSLRVVDAATGRDLDQIELRSRKHWRARIEEVTPSESPFVENVLSGGRSPVDLPKAERLVTYWARSPGFAWGFVEVDHSAGGEHRVELHRAATLSVFVDGELEPLGKGVHDYIRLRRQPEGWHWNFAASREVPAEGPTLFGSLPPGRYLVCFERGDEEGVRRAAQEWIEIAAEETQQVILVPDPSALVVTTAHLRGSLVFAERYEHEQRLTLGLSPVERDSGQKPVRLRLKDMEADPDLQGIFRWDAGQVVPGTYVAYLGELQHRQVIEVDQATEVEVAIEVPELTTVYVDVVDAATGEELKPQRLSWSDGALEGISTNMSLDVTRDSKAQRWRFVAPAGEVELSCSLDGYRGDYRTIELKGGVQEVSLELETARGLRIAVYQGETRVRPDYRFWFGARAWNADGTTPVSTGSAESASDEHILLFDYPGEYRLTFPELEGYAPIEPMQVLVPESGLADVKVSVGPE